MDLEKVKKTYLPMTETMDYILYSLKKERHGYAIMQHVEKISNHKIKIGSGTIYNTLSRLERDKLIKVVEENQRKKVYKLTEIGEEILSLEVIRLKELYENGVKALS